MANKLPWFTHDHDAHADGWIRHLVRKQGHVAGWMWWVLIELHHKHGVGDILKRDINDVAKDCLTSASVVTRVLTEMGGQFEGKTKVRWNLDGTELQLKIPKLRKRQAKLKSKIPAKFRQCSSNVPIEREGERQEERHNGVVGKAKTFTPPSLEEVKAYCQERNNKVDASRFLNFYESKGWMIGKNKMRSWQAAVRTWEQEAGFNAPVSKKSAEVWTCKTCGKGRPEVEPDPDAWDGDQCKTCSKELA